MGCGEKVSPPSLQAPRPRWHWERQGSPAGPRSPTPCGRCSPPPRGPFLLLSQTLQTSTQTLAQGLEKTTVSAGVHGLLPTESIPFLFHPGIAHQPLPTGPLEISLGAPTLEPPEDGVLSLVGSLEGVDLSSDPPWSAEGPLPAVCCPEFAVFLAAPSRPWKFSRCFLLSTL